MRLIAEGAEARVFSDGSRIVKERISKGYRLPELDARLRKFRTNREVKVLSLLKKAGVNVPDVISHPARSTTIELSLIGGSKLRDSLSRSSCAGICGEIGRQVGLMHHAGVIHADLTTSNMILSGGRVFLVDFGLSFLSHKAEDMAVDIHLFRQALEGSHSAISEESFAAFVKGYSEANEKHGIVLSRLGKVSGRGRHKSRSG